jgi:hypothetical protein
MELNMESLLALLIRRHINIRFSSLVLVDLVLLVLSGFLGIFFWLVCFTWSILFHVVVVVIVSLLLLLLSLLVVCIMKLRWQFAVCLSF